MGRSTTRLPLSNKYEKASFLKKFPQWLIVFLCSVDSMVPRGGSTPTILSTQFTGTWIFLTVICESTNLKSINAKSQRSSDVVPELFISYDNNGIDSYAATVASVVLSSPSSPLHPLLVDVAAAAFAAVAIVVAVVAVVAVVGVVAVVVVAADIVAAVDTIPAVAATAI